MVFEFTPDEVQSLAKTVIHHYELKGFKVSVERPIDSSAPYRTTILASKGSMKILVEAQRIPEYHNALRNFVLWLHAKRLHTEMYLVTHEDANLSPKILKSLKEDGVGILTTTGNSVQILSPALNPALTVITHPELKLGQFKKPVEQAVEKFNTVNRKHGLQDMCELVEDATKKLLIKAVKKGMMKIDSSAAEKMDWSSRINTLASINQYQPSLIPLVDDNLKNDLHSFRGARNLVDHPPKGKQNSHKIATQYTERMLMGPRLLATISSILRKIQ